VSRRQKLEEMLAVDPNDPFLHYALALELVKLGERIAGLKRLSEMSVQFPDHVPALFRRGQLLAEDGDAAAARDVLNQGIRVALRVGDEHAVAEMRELLETL
jgi:predicted Zn-dependent protease